MKLSLTIVLFATLLTAGRAQAQNRELSFQRLPHEVRQHITRVRSSCKELNPDFKPFNDTQGVQEIILEDGGREALLVDNEALCDVDMAGANCTNRGCDLLIWERVSQTAWRLIFKEHLHRKFVSINRRSGRLQAIVMSIYAGDPRCRPEPKREYTSGMSCDLIATYQSGSWRWQLIR